MAGKNQNFPLVQFQPHSARNDVYLQVLTITTWQQGPNVAVPPGARVSILPSGHGVAGVDMSVQIGDPEGNNWIFVAGNSTVPVPLTVSNLNQIWTRASVGGYCTIFLQDSAVG